MADGSVHARRVQHNGNTKAAAADKHDAHEHGHDDKHSHGIFGHTHKHGEDGHDHGGQLIETLQTGGDRGSRITLIGLGANVVLTSAKGVAGLYMNSAALLADAGHSLSDLLGDFVVLFSWRLSRRPASSRYPYGLAKFETAGTTIVALLLIGGALGIGLHALSLLLTAIAEVVPALPPGVLHDVLQNATHAAHNLPVHGHGHEHVLDPNAAWFAAASVLSKEWLFRVTKRVADEEGSPVLKANAYHHRSDAYSSMVALVAIMGSSWFPALPLDPIGGFLVSIVILQQGLSIFGGAFKELTDASVSTTTLRSLSKALSTLTSAPQTTPENPIAVSAPRLLYAHDLRARRAGSQLFVDLTAGVPHSLTVGQVSELEGKILEALKAARKDVREVRVRFEGVDEHVEGEHEHSHQR